MELLNMKEQQTNTDGVMVGADWLIRMVHGTMVTGISGLDMELVSSISILMARELSTEANGSTTWSMESEKKNIRRKSLAATI